MRLACPACGAEMSLDVLLSVEAARDAVLAALLLPAPLGRLLVQYIALFRLLPRALEGGGRAIARQLSWERVAALFGDLALPMAEGRFQRRGRTYVATIDYWRAALEEILARREALSLPLKSHGYLYEIIAGYSERAEKAAEDLRERNRRYPYSQERGGAGSGPDASVAEVAARAMPEEVREKLRGLGVLKRAAKGPANAE